MTPCTLRREDCLVGSALAERFGLARPHAGSMSLQQQSQTTDLFWDCEPHRGTDAATTLPTTATEEKGKERALSLFESVITAYPPVLESLLSQLPTAALLELHHTSRHLRDFLRNYPLAWKTLSFRLPQPAVTVGSPGNETPDSRERQSKQYSFDALLRQVIAPSGIRLTNLDRCQRRCAREHCACAAH